MLNSKKKRIHVSPVALADRIFDESRHGYSSDATCNTDTSFKHEETRGEKGEREELKRDRKRKRRESDANASK